MLGSLLLPMIAVISQQSGQRLIYEHKNYFVYDEPNSCALYADYSDTSMLRMSFKESEKTVYFTYYADKWADMQVGDTITISLATNDDPKNLLGYASNVVSNGKKKGLNANGGDEMLDYLQGAKTLRLLGPHRIELAYLDISEMDVALKRLKACGLEK